MQTKIFPLNAAVSSSTSSNTAKHNRFEYNLPGNTKISTLFNRRISFFERPIAFPAFNLIVIDVDVDYVLVLCDMLRIVCEACAFWFFAYGHYRESAFSSQAKEYCSAIARCCDAITGDPNAWPIQMASPSNCKLKPYEVMTARFMFSHRMLVSWSLKVERPITFHFGGKGSLEKCIFQKQINISVKAMLLLKLRRS